MFGKVALIAIGVKNESAEKQLIIPASVIVGTPSIHRFMW